MNAAMHIYYWRFLRRLPLWRVFSAIIPAVLLSAWLARQQMPTIGASTVVFAEIGIVLAYMKRKADIIRALVTLAMVFTLTGLFAPNINTLIHVYAIAIAYAAYRLTENMNLIIYDYEKKQIP